LAGQPARTIRVANEYQRNLAALVEAVDRILPPRYRIGYRTKESLLARFEEIPNVDLSEASQPLLAIILEKHINTRIDWLFQNHAIEQHTVLFSMKGLITIFEKYLLQTGVAPERAREEAAKLQTVARERYAASWWMGHSTPRPTRMRVTISTACMTKSACQASRSDTAPPLTWRPHHPRFLH
jgi:hypothetical protein